MKSISSCHYGDTGNSLVIARTHMIDKSQWKGEWAIMFSFQSCLTIYRTFQAKDSMINTSAITAVTNSHDLK